MIFIVYIIILNIIKYKYCYMYLYSISHVDIIHINLQYIG